MFGRVQNSAIATFLLDQGQLHRRNTSFLIVTYSHNLVDCTHFTEFKNKFILRELDQA